MRIRTTIAFGMLLGALALAPAAQAKGTLYVTGTNTNNVGAHTLGPNGELTPLSGSPFATGNTPLGVAITPNARNLYTGNNGNDTISVFTIGSSGALTAGTTVNAPPMSDPTGLAITPNGSFLFSANRNNGAGNSVTTYAINADNGALTLVTTTPTTAGSSPEGVAVSPSGNNVYVANTNTDNISVFNLAADGTLTANGAAVAAGDGPKGLGLTPDGRFLYVANSNSDTISAYSVSEGGGLTPIGTFATGDLPEMVGLTQDGRFLYVPNFTSGNVNGYAIGADGALTPVPGQPFGAITQPFGVDAAPNSRVYVTNFNNAMASSVNAYSFDSGGTLSPLSGSPFAAGVNGAEIQSVVVTPNQGPTALFTGGVVSTREARGGGITAEFNASGSSDSDGGSIAAYVWDFGDGTQVETTTSPTISHNFAAEGDYQVTLTVVDDQGCSNQVLFTGQTVDCNGSSAARMTQTVQVAGGTPPDLKLKGKKQELAKKVTVTAKTADDTTAVAKGKLRIEPDNGKKKSFDLKKATKDLDAGEKTKVKPKLSKKAYNEAKKALKNKGKVSAKVNVKVTDDNLDTDKDSVKVKLTKP